MPGQPRSWWATHVLMFILGAWGGSWSIAAIHTRSWGALVAILGLMVFSVTMDYRWDKDRSDEQ